MPRSPNKRHGTVPGCNACKVHLQMGAMRDSEPPRRWPHPRLQTPSSRSARVRPLRRPSLPESRRHLAPSARQPCRGWRPARGVRAGHGRRSQRAQRPAGRRIVKGLSCQGPVLLRACPAKGLRNEAQATPAPPRLVSRCPALNFKKKIPVTWDCEPKPSRRLNEQ